MRNAKRKVVAPKVSRRREKDRERGRGQVRLVSHDELSLSIVRSCQEIAQRELDLTFLSADEANFFDIATIHDDTDNFVSDGTFCLSDFLIFPEHTFSRHLPGSSSRLGNAERWNLCSKENVTRTLREKRQFNQWSRRKQLPPPPPDTYRRLYFI